jgi:hypothetical protein
MSKTKWEEYQEKLAKKQEDIRLLAKEEVLEYANDDQVITEKEKVARPWDFLNPNTEYVDQDLANGRYEICKGCPELIKATKQCKQCGCFMAIKTKLAHASCPIGKW